jgi:hypothetical protein
MKTLPKEYKLLKEIGKSLEDFFKSPDTLCEIRSTELYDIVSKNSYLKSEFPTGKIFNQFLRIQHQNGIMSSFLSYHVDTTNRNFYQWHFRRKHVSHARESINNETIEGTYNYYKNSKTNIATDGTKLNSKQEVFIYEQLKKCSHLLIKLEYPITKYGETKYVDFIIQNKLNRKEFYWEHFGMTNNEHYKTKMTDKIEWYRNNGFRNIEDGGNLIYTYYSTDNRLKKDVDKYLEKIKATNNV